MKQISVKLVSLIYILVSLQIQAIALQPDYSDIRPPSFGITLTLENVFGFYPVVFGSLGLSPTLDFTFYDAKWTKPNLKEGIYASEFYKLSTNIPMN